MERSYETKRHVLIGILAITALITGSSSQANAASNPQGSTMIHIFVGGDLHVMSVLGNRYFVTGHNGGGMSDNGGKSWTSIPALKDADVMSWTTTSKSILAGAHIGLFKSMDKGATFKQIKFYQSASDVHAIGAAGNYVYLASPQVGLLKSNDGGVTWKIQNTKVGQNFMGSILVDSKNPKRIISSDMSMGLMISTDSGVTWSPFGGPASPMALGWDSNNAKLIGTSAQIYTSVDAGKSWQSPLKK